jgi:hypothetical protein
MGALAVPLLEGAAARVLAGLGAGAAGAVAAESARKRQKEAEKAAAAPIARVDVCSEEKSKCKDCPPDKGTPFLRKTAGWSDDSITYQVRIAQMPPAPPGQITEWRFRNVEFDGFDSALCLLKEAKAGYDQFFDQWGGFKYAFQAKIFEKMTGQAVEQNNAATPKPPVQLQWNFKEPVSYRYMAKVFMRATPEIEVLYRP